jgi:hypothetical protein
LLIPSYRSRPPKRPAAQLSNASFTGWFVSQAVSGLNSVRGKSEQRVSHQPVRTIVCSAVIAGEEPQDGLRGASESNVWKIRLALRLLRHRIVAMCFCACEGSTCQVYSPPYVSKGVKRRPLISSETLAQTPSRESSINQLLIIELSIFELLCSGFDCQVDKPPRSNCFANLFLSR